MKHFKVPAKIKPGDHVAVVSLSRAAPAVAPQIHEQAMQRLRDELGIIPVEYPTTRKLNASGEERARDYLDALKDPEIKAVLATIGGFSECEMMPFLDADVVRAHPKLFLGYSDNTNLLNYLWECGVTGFYGGSTQIQIGPGPRVEDYHLKYLRAALFDGGELELTLPADSEDDGVDPADPRSLTEFGARDPLPEPVWGGPKRKVSGHTWGGCIEILDQIALFDRMPSNADLEGAIILLESFNSELTLQQFQFWVRGLGERGVFEAANGVMLGHTRTQSPAGDRTLEQRREILAARAQIVIDTVTRYNSDAVVVAGYPFGHTRPQLLLPYGGKVSLDGEKQIVTADYN